MVVNKNPGNIGLQHFAKDDELTLDQVKEFIEANKADPAISEFIVSISVDKPLNPELVAAYLQTVEGKNLIQPMMDKRVTDAIKTHDDTSKPKIDAAIKAGIAAEMLRLNPQETPEQRRLRELEDKDRKRDEEWENEKKIAKIKELAYKANIDPSFIEGINFNSPEEFNLYSQRFTEFTNKEVERKVNERMASIAPKPQAGKGPDERPDISKLTDKEILVMEMSGQLDTLLKGE